MSIIKYKNILLYIITKYTSIIIFFERVIGTGVGVSIELIIILGSAVDFYVLIKIYINIFLLLI